MTRVKPFKGIEQRYTTVAFFYIKTRIFYEPHQQTTTTEHKIPRITTVLCICQTYFTVVSYELVECPRL